MKKTIAKNESGRRTRTTTYQRARSARTDGRLGVAPLRSDELDDAPDARQALPDDEVEGEAVRVRAEHDVRVVARVPHDGGPCRRVRRDVERGELGGRGR